MTAFFPDSRTLRTATLVTALSVSLMGYSDDTIGVEFAGAESPQLHIYATEGEEEGEIDTHFQMERCQLTLWADAMDEDVVITEGKCFVSTDCDDREACGDEEVSHDLFGEIGGGTCDG